MSSSDRLPANKNSAPLHPATVHFPIAFISLACALDVLFGAATSNATSSLVTSIYDVTPYLGDISRASHYANFLGFVTAIPAVLSGGQQLVGMIKALGLSTNVKDSNGRTVNKGMSPKLKVAFAHAALNDLAVVATAWKWWSRREHAAFVPDSLNILVSAVLLPGLLFSAYLGGELVYKYSVGVTKLAKEVKAKGN